MSLLGKLKLQKLKITSFKDAKRESKKGEFEVMFNPTSIRQNYSIKYSRKQALNSTSRQAVYIFSNPRVLKLELIIDGTGVTEMGITQFKKKKSVTEQVSDLIDKAFRMDESQHEPAYLTVEWGDLDWGEQEKGAKFKCRLESVDITYTSFERNGTPLRAKLDVSLISDIEPERRVVEEGKESPDITHRRIVVQGDTLPLLTKEIYGTSKYYLQVAQANNLNDFRNLTPGQELFFPPLES